MSSGKGRWIGRWIGILLACACLCALYGRYISGPIQVDPAVVDSDKLALLAANWEKLVQSDAFVEWSADQVRDGNHVIAYAKSRNESSQLADTLFFIVVMDGESEYEDWRLRASYERKGILDALYGLGRFGECTSYFYAQGNGCAIQGTFYESSGTAREFNDIMRTALEIVSDQQGERQDEID